MAAERFRLLQTVAFISVTNIQDRQSTGNSLFCAAPGTKLTYAVTRNIVRPSGRRRFRRGFRSDPRRNRRQSPTTPPLPYYKWRRLFATDADTKQQCTETTTCWNGSFRKIFHSKRWQSVSEIQHYCGELSFVDTYNKYETKFLSSIISTHYSPACVRIWTWIDKQLCALDL